MHLVEKLPIVFGTHGVVRNFSFVYRVLPLVDKRLELRSLPLLWFQFAMEPFIDSFISSRYVVVASILGCDIIDELKRVQQDVFLALVELLVGAVVGLRFLLDVLDFTQVHFLLQDL